MQTRNIKFLVVLVALIAAMLGGYAAGKSVPAYKLIPGLPPLVKSHAPPQTRNGLTASISAVYADALRVVLAVDIPADYYIGDIKLKDEDGDNIHAGMANESTDDPSQWILEFNPEIPFEDRLKGTVEFSLSTMPGGDESAALYSFDLDLPVHPAQMFIPAQNAGYGALVDRIIATPSYTQVYLCYEKPDRQDWTIGGDASLKIGGREAPLHSYVLLYDSDYGDMGKSVEPDWTPPAGTNRCVKLGFALGDEDPRLMTLDITTLERFVPEVISPDRVKSVVQRLEEYGIEMNYDGDVWAFESLPPDMTEQEAAHLFLSALDYRREVFWYFDLQVQPEREATARFSTSTYGAPQPIPHSETETKIAAEVASQIRAFDISPDEKFIAFATSEGIIFHDLESYKRILAMSEGENFYLAGWSPDGGKFAAVGLSDLGENPGKVRLIVWDTSDWQTVFEIAEDEAPDGLYGNFAWSPDGSLLAVAITQRSVFVYDIETGKVVSTQADIAPGGLSWSPDGTRLVAMGDFAGGIRRWVVGTDKSVRLFDRNAGGMGVISWSPDGSRIAAGYFDGQVCLWTVETNRCDGRIMAHRNMVTGLAWSPNGDQLATGGGIIRIWDSYRGKNIVSFGLNQMSIYTRLEWLASGRIIVSSEAGYASAAPTIVRLWDTNTGQILFEFKGANGEWGR